MAGTMRKRGNNSYYLEYMYEGERFSQTVKASSSSEASRKLAQFVTEIEKGHYKKISDILFVEMSQLFLDKYAVDNLSPSTVRNYKSMLNYRILDEFGQMKGNKIKRLNIQEFANKLVNEYNSSSKTAKIYIDLISAIFNKMIEWDLLEYNPATKISIPKNFEKRRKKVILYSYDEVKEFLKCLENLDDKELQIAIYSSFVTGARRGEILGLSFQKIDFKRCSIDLCSNVIPITGGTQEKDLKNKKNRLFYVPESYINKVKDYYDFLGRPPKNTKLFSMHPDTYSKRFKHFLKENNLREVQLKDLRALNESILVNQGIDIVSAAKRIGHLPSTATNYYLDQIPEEDKKASNILENLF